MDRQDYPVGTDLMVAYESPRENRIRGIVGTVVADRYPDSVLALDTEVGVLRIPWRHVTKIERCP